MDSAAEKLIRDASYMIEDENLYGALRLLDALLKQDPRNVNALLNKGAILQNLGHMRRAVACYDRALRAEPGNPDALLNKGSALHAEGDYKDAIACYDILLRGGRASPPALLYKGLSLAELGALEDAIRHFDGALDGDPELELARISRDMALNMLDEKTSPRGAP